MGVGMSPGRRHPDLRHYLLLETVFLLSGKGIVLRTLTVIGKLRRNGHDTRP